MDCDGLGLRVGGVARVFSRVRGLGALDQQEAGCGVALLSDDAHTTARRVVTDDLLQQSPHTHTLKYTPN